MTDYKFDMDGTAEFYLRLELTNWKHLSSVRIDEIVKDCRSAEMGWERIKEELDQAVRNVAEKFMDEWVCKRCGGYKGEKDECESCLGEEMAK